MGSWRRRGSTESLAPERWRRRRARGRSGEFGSGKGSGRGSAALCGAANRGAEEVEDATRFYAPGSAFSVPWLNTDASRRTNVSFINPDQTDATVSVEVSVQTAQ